MFLSLPLITPRDSHELWFGSPHPYRTQSTQSANDTTHGNPPRRNANHAFSSRAMVSTTSPASSLCALLLEERALRVRKQNIASFGYSWIKPAGCPKTMLGMKEEEAEREEALAAAAAEMAAASAAVDPGVEGMNGFGGRPEPQMDADIQDDTAMERDLDDDIPDADADGLVEEGEEALEDDDVVDEEGYMERDLDDDIPEALDEAQNDSDDQPDLDDEIPVAGDDEDMSEGMVRDLDEDIPEAAESGSAQNEEWQHTDTEAELDDDDDDDFSNDPFAESFRASASSNRGLPLPPLRREIETEAQRRFLQRWSGGGDSVGSTSLLVDDDALRASVASHSSQRGVFGRFRRTGGPRDSFD